MKDVMARITHGRQIRKPLFADPLIGLVVQDQNRIGRATESAFLRSLRVGPIPPADFSPLRRFDVGLVVGKAELSERRFSATAPINASVGCLAFLRDSL